MEFYDITDEFIDERTKRAKKSDTKEKKSKVKYISELDGEFESSAKRKNSKNPSKNPIAIFMRMSPFGKKFVLALLGLFILAILVCAFLAYSATFTKSENVKPLSDEGLLSLNEKLDSSYPEQRTAILKELPYSVTKANLDVWAGSAILIDASNGCVLFEKNADKIIPPASIAKLFVMYIVFKEVEAGRFSLDDVVPLPERSWAINMPRDASLMF